MLLAGNPDALYMVDGSGRVTWMNRAAEELLGWTASETLGRVLHDLIHDRRPDGSPYPQATCPLRNAVRTGLTVQDHEDVFRHKDGHGIPVLCSNAPLVRDDVVVGAALVVHDLRERQAAEQQLRLHAALLGSIKAAIVATDLHGRVSYWNLGAESLFGRTAAEAMHRPAPFPAVLGLDEGQRAALLAGRDTVLEGEVARADEPSRWVAVHTAVLRDSAGAPAGFVSLVDDVTERTRAARRHRERLHHLTEVALAATTGVALGDVLGLIAEQARAIVGAHRSAITVSADPGTVQAPPRTWTAVGPSGGAGAWRDDERIAALASASGRPIRLTEAELQADPAWRGAGGGDTPLRGLLAAPLLGHRRQTLGVIVLAERFEGDFTEEDQAILVQLAQLASAAVENVRLLSAAEAARGEAEATNRAKDEFLAMLSHELRNPLAAIRTSLHVARRRPADERALGIAERQTTHLSRLLEDLLDVARITQGRIQLRAERVALRAVVERAVETTAETIRERGHRLSVILPPGEVAVDADPARLEQVLVNLLDNAAAYTPPGGTIRLLAEREGAELVVRVQDSGIGIALELLPHVFDLFSQAQRPLDRADGGLGIGLTIVKHLVELHGGRIEAHSEGPGQGAEFVVHLPLPADAVDAASTPDDGKALRILLVEDNTDTARSLAMLVETVWGHRLVVAHDGFAALAAVRTSSFDVALVDLGLPGIDGFEVARRLRETPGGEHTFLVAVTGYGRSEDRERGVEAGFVEHLVKPVDPDRLEALLADVPRRRRLVATG